MECLTCPVTDKAQQDAVIDAAIKAAYLDPTAHGRHKKFWLCTAAAP